MNSTEDNLRQTVIDILSSQEKELEKKASQYLDAVQSLFYAQETTSTAEDKRKLAQTNYGYYEKFSEKVAHLKDYASTLLSLTNQSKQLVRNTISLCATNASNVQIAANSIVKLGSDIGSVFSIVNSLDFGSDIYRMSEQCLTMINTTAPLAEILAQQAMELSVETAEINSGALGSSVEKIKASIDNLTSNADTQLASAMDYLDVCEKTLKTAQTVENEAQQTLASSHTIFQSSQCSFLSATEILNLNLHLKDLSLSSFTVCFNYIKGISDKDNNRQNIVESYYIFLVKSRERAAFTMAMAQQLILTPRAFVEVTPKDTDKATNVSVEIKISDMTDSDGDPIQPEQEYCVLVLAVYTTDYKKTINNFDDFLSAPSSPFLLNERSTLQHAKIEHIKSEKAANTLGFRLRKTTEQELNPAYSNTPQRSQLAEDQYQQEKLKRDINSLTYELRALNSLLDRVTSDKSQILSIQKQYEQILQDSRALKQLSSDCLNNINSANRRSIAIAKETKDLVDHLMYSSDLVTKLANLIVRKKALNPLISQELITQVIQSTKDTDKAIALSLITLKSSFTAESACLSSQAALSLINEECNTLYKLLTDSNSDKHSLKAQLEESILSASTKRTQIAQAIQQISAELKIKRSSQKN